MKVGCLLVFAAWSGAFGMYEVAAPRVSVLFEEPRLEGYAQRVAEAAEHALDVLVPLFDVEPPAITLLLDDGTDVYNAFAPPLPRPRVVLRALFPTETPLGYRAEDDLYLLLVHEIMHSLQLTYTELPEATARPQRLGLVGEDVARFPPMWLLEGIAVWAESVFTEGGRLRDARTVGLTHASALDGDLPELSEISLATFDRWPAGAARYLYGGQFFAFLVENYGFRTVRDALRYFNAGAFTDTFSDAWQSATGDDLEALWDLWRDEVSREALDRALAASGGQVVTDSGWHTRAPAISPDGGQLAWASWPPAIKVADLRPGDAHLSNERIVIADRLPTTLDWLDDRTLVYSRIHRTIGSAYSELYALDVATGVERRLTTGERARLPAVTEQGCIVFVRDVVAEGSQLRRWCAGNVETLWMAPSGRHIVGTAVSGRGRVALSVWRSGYVDIGLLVDGEVRYVTGDRHQNLDPAWDGEEALLFRSDRDEGGAFDLYRLDLEHGALTRLTRTVGGAFAPAVGVDEVWYAELRAGGFDIAVLREVAGEPESLEQVGEAPRHRPVERSHPVLAYSPWPSLVPFGWLPMAWEGAGNLSAPLVGVSIFGQDDSGRHRYQLDAGYGARLHGPLGGAHVSLRYDHRRDPLLSAFDGHEPLSFGMRLGIWPQRGHLGPGTENAAGVQVDFSAVLPIDDWRARVGMTLGAVYFPSFGAPQLDGRVDAALTNLRFDSFGYATRGLRLGATGVLSATRAGPSRGAWLDGSYYAPTGPRSAVQLALRGGYRPAPPVPVSVLSDLAAFGTVGYRLSLPLELRFGDGLHALERISLEPRVRGWFANGLGAGGDITLSFDAVLGYAAQASLSFTVGYAEALWYRAQVRLPYW